MKKQQKQQRLYTTNGEEILISCVRQGFIRNVFKVIKRAIKSSTWRWPAVAAVTVKVEEDEDEMDRFQLDREVAEMAAVIALVLLPTMLDYDDGFRIKDAESLLFVIPTTMDG